MLRPFESDPQLALLASMAPRGTIRTQFLYIVSYGVTLSVCASYSEYEDKVLHAYIYIYIYIYIIMYIFY